MPSTRSQKREKDDSGVAELKEEPKVKKTKMKEAATKDKEKKETVPDVGKKGKEKPAESNKEESAAGSLAKIVKITVEACTS